MSLVYSAPHTPSRQKLLNGLVPDDFYRRLFISPCLSGWDRGEEKIGTWSCATGPLSRSQLNTIGRLKDAGIITNDLVVLPNTSTTCLANNGTHVSLGSQMLTALAKDLHSPFSPAAENYFGDLVIKIIEHFLPLFVCTYSADPYRIDFADFHPERVLGFLPHELDFTHLRMIWRRWQQKAGNRFFGRTVTPFGPRWLDRRLAKFLSLSGDLIPDFRLIDYLVTLLSTDTSPGLNGMSGNHERLKAELAEMRVFDAGMSIYLPYRQRIWARAGYAGFEGRSYSLFPSLLADMAEAVDLQNLITTLACRYVLQGQDPSSRHPRPAVHRKRTAADILCQRHRHPDLLRAGGYGQQPAAGEHPLMFRMLTSARVSSLLAFWRYDRTAGGTGGDASIRGRKLFAAIGADFRECLEPLSFFDSPRKVFERRIRYWENRPMSDSPRAIVAPADARLLVGSLAETSSLFIQEKYFEHKELLGTYGPWRSGFPAGTSPSFG